jgi:diadenosine tetraphosphate (Ap4A) HIT family hydrolase
MVEASASCMACDLVSGALYLPGGVVHSTRYWQVEHCVGALGLGTLVAKPLRHVERVADLTDSEVAEMGPLLRDTSAVVDELSNPRQVYVCAWSHGPAHLHYVVQPETDEAVRTFGAQGAQLQAAMFSAGYYPDNAAVEQYSERARRAFAFRSTAQPV